MDNCDTCAELSAELRELTLYAKNLELRLNESRARTQALIARIEANREVVDL
jgi:hypothetical protein